MPDPTGSVPYRAGLAVLDVEGREVRTLVDTGGTALCMSQWLADELGLRVHERLVEDGAMVSILDTPEITVGGATLDTDGITAYGFEDTRPLGLAARGAELLLPATVLRRHHVVLDEPAGALTVSASAPPERRGLPVACTIDPGTGVVITTVQVDGEAIELVIDTALSCCLAADRVTRRWQGSRPEWPASISAVGPGNMTGMPLEARVPMVRVPSIEWGQFTIPEAAFAWRGDSDVVADGSLGGNVLKLFRVEIDYSVATVRVEQGRPFAEHDGELVGVVLAMGEEAWEVTATVSGLEDVHPGDLLMAVDGQDVGGAVLPEVLDLLRGTPGDRHRLTLLRGEETLDVDAPVLRLL